MKELECIVRGRVQMVMFRDFAQRHARRLKLSGVVRNMTDGTVHVLAQGEEGALREYLRRLSKGPLLARVESLSILWREPQTAHIDFTINHGTHDSI